ncbi:hypothetical protein RUND412_001530 [Rhizina undulata]
MFILILRIIFLASAAVNAHMYMSHPFALDQQDNPNTVTPDYNYNAPLDANGDNFPCKGYHKLLGTPAGATVAMWAAGSQQYFVIEGSAPQGGGSCQASFSEDGGATWKVAKSFIGNCPVAGSQFDFTVPKETKSGNILFAWSWFNKIGNREMYMNCASVTITSGGSGLGAYPNMFTANINNGCSTTEGIDVVFLDPGNDFTNVATNPGPPVGNCGSVGLNPPTEPFSVLSPSETPAAILPAQANNSSPMGFSNSSITLETETTSESTAIPSGNTSLVPLETKQSGFVTAPTQDRMTITTITLNSTVTAFTTSIITIPYASSADPTRTIPGCECTCGGESGFVINISPAGPVTKNIQSSSSPDRQRKYFCS